jgi:signal transduction histidine kinase
LLTALKPHVAKEHRRPWTELEASLGEAMKELRTFSYLMHPPALDRQGLRNSLQRYVDGFADRCGLSCKLRTNHRAERFSLRVQRSVFRIVQEALANVYRHASATRVSIELRRIGVHLHVIITDNGRGVDKAVERSAYNRPRSGVGIRGIRIRLSKLKGRLRISRAPGGGTRLHAVLPVSEGSVEFAAGKK